jgi:hypothetical protein
MGNTLTIPSGKNYTISYTKHSKFKAVPNLESETNLVTGININNRTHLDLIYSVFYNNINNNGYSLKVGKQLKEVPAGLTLEELLKNIIKYGFWNSDRSKTLKDIVVTPKCYSPKPKVIRSLVYSGNVLIAGLIIDSALSKVLFNVELDEIVTEIVLVIGYNENEILIKTTWNPEIVGIPNEHISSIKEIWNIEIQSPEDKYFDEKNKESN